jgi:hypothetical protein
MRNSILLFFLAFTLNLNAQNNDYLIRLDGVGALKLDMKVSEVEKILGRKITFKNQNENGAYADTIKAKYKNADISLYFDRDYTDDTNFVMVLSGMMVTNPQFKTKEGITIGTDKLKIINTYEMSRLSVMPDYTDDSYTTISKTLASIWVYSDESENSLVFHLKNKKVISIEVMRFYGD